MGDISESDMKKDISKSPSVDVSPAQIARLEKLIKTFSSKIVSSPTSRIDGEIQWALKEMVKCLNVDRCAMWEVIQDNTAQARCLNHYNIPEFRDFMHPKPLPWFINKIRDIEVICISCLDGLPKEASLYKKSLGATGIKSYVIVPYKISGRIVNAIAFACLRKEKRFPAELIPVLKLAGEIITGAIHRKKMEEKYESSLIEMHQTPGQDHLDDRYLRRDQEHERAYCNIIGRSVAIQKVFSRIEQVAPTGSIVLILGETGTGKGLIARAIHNLSPCRNHSLVSVNCAAIPSTLIECELFGREKGAFTGSDSRQIGRFELADKSTLILDEIGELSLELQAKLLRVIQDGEFERLGSPKTIKTDARIIAITSKDLKGEVLQKHFRQELYYRLHVFPITLPPLRERNEDIPMLVDHFVRVFSRKMGKEISKIPNHAMKALCSYAWPGNVRQLEHVIERAVIMARGDILDEEVFPEFSDSTEKAPILQRTSENTLDGKHLVSLFECDLIKNTLEECNGNIFKSAKRLSISRASLYRKMKKYGIVLSRNVHN